MGSASGWRIFLDRRLHVALVSQQETSAALVRNRNQDVVPRNRPLNTAHPYAFISVERSNEYRRCPSPAQDHSVRRNALHWSPPGRPCRKVTFYERLCKHANTIKCDLHSATRRQLQKQFQRNLLLQVHVSLENGATIRTNIHVMPGAMFEL